MLARRLLLAVPLAAALLSAGCRSAMWQEVEPPPVRPKVTVDGQRPTPELLAEVQARPDALVDVPPGDQPLETMQPPDTEVVPAMFRLPAPSRAEAGIASQFPHDAAVQRASHSTSAVRTDQANRAESRRDTAAAWQANASTNATSRSARDSGTPDASANRPARHTPPGNAVKHVHHPPSGRVARNERGGLNNLSGISGNDHQIGPPRALEPDPPRGRVDSVGSSQNPLFLMEENASQRHPQRAPQRIRAKGFSSDAGGQSVAVLEIDRQETVVVTKGRAIVLDDDRGERVLIVSRITGYSVELIDETTNEVIRVR